APGRAGHPVAARARQPGGATAGSAPGPASLGSAGRARARCAAWCQRAHPARQLAPGGRCLAGRRARRLRRARRAARPTRGAVDRRPHRAAALDHRSACGTVHAPARAGARRRRQPAGHHLTAHPARGDRDAAQAACRPARPAVVRRARRAQPVRRPAGLGRCDRGQCRLGQPALRSLRHAGTGGSGVCRTGARPGGDVCAGTAGTWPSVRCRRCFRNAAATSPIARNPAHRCTGACAPARM
ncbi:hypothetical protein XPN_0484, partial [Xanthomonas arboricola pv. pruni MAFF 301427]